MRIFLALLTLLALAASAPAPSKPKAPHLSPTTSKSVTPTPTASPMPSLPPPTEGSFSRTAPDGTLVMGRAGTLRTYCVQVEDVIIWLSPAEPAAVVDQVLGSANGWTAGGLWRFQRVPDCAAADLRIRLAIATTVDKMCHPAADTEGKYSCRNGDDVMLNVERWIFGVPHFPDINIYRHMVVNHEVGHYLGHGHSACRGKGKPAAVMQQQSISLRGCLINPHPYPDGVSYYS